MNITRQQAIFEIQAQDRVPEAFLIELGSKPKYMKSELLKFLNNHSECKITNFLTIGENKK